MNLQGLRKQYQDKKPLYERLKEEALFVLEPALKREGIKVHSVTSRLKTIDSFINKVQEKNQVLAGQAHDPFEETHDIVGLRVVCLFLSDIARIGEVIRTCFSVTAEDNKLEGYDASSFGYLSAHFVASLKKEYSGPRYDQIVGLPIEIQVRTIAMHAWATISHYLDYKGELDVPKDLKRDLYALSGLFYVADTHFEMFFNLREASRDLIAGRFESNQSYSEQEINLDSLTAYLRNKFPDRKASSSDSISEVVTELSAAGYHTIGDIEKTVDRAWNAFLAYEQDRPPNSESGTRYADVGVIRVSFERVDENYVIKGVRSSLFSSEQRSKYERLMSAQT